MVEESLKLQLGLLSLKKEARLAIKVKSGLALSRPKRDWDEECDTQIQEEVIAAVC